MKDLSFLSQQERDVIEAYNRLKSKSEALPKKFGIAAFNIVFTVSILTFLKHNFLESSILFSYISPVLLIASTIVFFNYMLKFPLFDSRIKKLGIYMDTSLPVFYQIFDNKNSKKRYAIESKSWRNNYEPEVIGEFDTLDACQRQYDILTGKMVKEDKKLIEERLVINRKIKLSQSQEQERENWKVFETCLELQIHKRVRIKGDLYCNIEELAENFEEAKKQINQRFGDGSISQRRFQAAIDKLFYSILHSIQTSLCEGQDEAFLTENQRLAIEKLKAFSLHIADINRGNDKKQADRSLKESINDIDVLIKNIDSYKIYCFNKITIKSDHQDIETNNQQIPDVDYKKLSELLNQEQQSLFRSYKQLKKQCLEFKAFSDYFDEHLIRIMLLVMLLTAGVSAIILCLLEKSFDNIKHIICTSINIGLLVGPVIFILITFLTFFLSGLRSQKLYKSMHLLKAKLDKELPVFYELRQDIDYVYQKVFQKDERE